MARQPSSAQTVTERSRSRSPTLPEEGAWKFFPHIGYAMRYQDAWYKPIRFGWRYDRSEGGGSWHPTEWMYIGSGTGGSTATNPTYQADAVGRHPLQPLQPPSKAKPPTPDHPPGDPHEIPDLRHRQKEIIHNQMNHWWT